jgi:hypothetical protein
LRLPPSRASVAAIFAPEATKPAASGPVTHLGVALDVDVEEVRPWK